MDQATHERNWAQAEAWLEEGKACLLESLWKASGRDPFVYREMLQDLGLGADA